MLLYENPDKNGNVLTKHWMDLVWEVDAKVLELEVNRSVPCLPLLVLSVLQHEEQHRRSLDATLGCAVAKSATRTMSERHELTRSVP